jgi:hypothetical protein
MDGVDQPGTQKLAKCNRFAVDWPFYVSCAFGNRVVQAQAIYWRHHGPVWVAANLLTVLPDHVSVKATLISTLTLTEEVDLPYALAIPLGAELLDQSTHVLPCLLIVSIDDMK